MILARELSQKIHTEMRVSVVIPTHNRPEKLADLIASLKRQNLGAGEYEIIVIDDGSSPPVALPSQESGPCTSLVRTCGGERSAARNMGSERAQGELLVFLDDDMLVGESFLATYWHAHQEWPDAVLSGVSFLPEDARATPFGRFRQRLEQSPTPQRPAIVANGCAAGNMAVPRRIFLELGGFDADIDSGEDQDFGLRHAARGGRTAVVPDASSLHRDGALDVRDYCRRMEWGYEYMIPFCQKYPALPANIERERVNGYHRWSQGTTHEAASKLAKSVLAFWPIREALYGFAALLERIAPDSRALDRTYRLLLGIAIFTGYRKGLKRFGSVAAVGRVSRPVAVGAAVKL